MDKISCVKYVEAYSEFSEDCPAIKLWIYKAYGYVEKVKEGIVLRFVKKISDDEKSGDFVVNGYFIPDEALITEHHRDYVSSLDSLGVGSSIGVVWTNLVRLLNTSDKSISPHGTKGVLVKNEKEYVVIKDPETAILEPFSVENQNKKPTYFIIPKALILKVHTIHE